MRTLRTLGALIILLLLCGVVLPQARKTNHCFHDESNAGWFEVVRSTGVFKAVNCASDYELTGDGLLKFTGKDFKLTFEIQKNGRTHVGTFSLSVSDMLFKGSIVDKEDGTIYFSIADKLGPDYFGNCTCSQVKP